MAGRFHACRQIYRAKEVVAWTESNRRWASWHVQAGTPLEVLMRLGGWRSLSMVLRYAHLAPGHLALHADAITTGPKLVQFKKAKAGKRRKVLE